jgi:hypothetical protein
VTAPRRSHGATALRAEIAGALSAGPRVTVLSAEAADIEAAMRELVTVDTKLDCASTAV